MRILAILITLALSPQIGMAESFLDGPPIGTYKTVDVAESGKCAKLCNEDTKICRGVVTIQPDVTQEFYQCFLNDGLANGSPFEIKPPVPLELDTALADLNTYRQTFGLNPVVLDSSLNMASQKHADDMASHGMISHTGTDGSSHSDRALEKGYIFSIIAENVASGQDSWDKVFKAWQDSPGHNENLLRSDVSEFGIALVYDRTTEYRYYWAMLLASPSQ